MAHMLEKVLKIELLPLREYLDRLIRQIFHKSLNAMIASLLRYVIAKVNALYFAVHDHMKFVHVGIIQKSPASTEGGLVLTFVIEPLAK